MTAKEVIKNYCKMNKGKDITYKDMSAIEQYGQLMYGKYYNQQTYAREWRNLKKKEIEVIDKSEKYGVWELT